MSRPHRARRLVLQGLCCLDVQGDRVMDLVMAFVGDSDEPLDTIVSARELLAAAWGDRPDCDVILTRHSKRWRLDRLAMVDRNILRLAVHEMLAAAAPPKVVISEAIKLAQEFSSTESPRFINGVLDAVRREIQEGLSPESPAAEPADPETKPEPPDKE